MRRMNLIPVIAVMVGLTCTAAMAATEHVTVSGAGTQDCSTWANACTLSVALSGASSGDELWAAAGTYAGPISLIDGVKIIGGFAGTETAASQSDPDTNVTTLDGGGSGAVVTSTSNSSSTVLRGFRITNGYDPSTLMDDTGGGGARLTDSNAMFVQCTFDGNSTSAWGGAVYMRGTGSPTFVNCRFSGNGAIDFGSGVVTPIAGGAVFVNDSSPSFTNCLFVNNTGMEGGAMASLSGPPTVTNCTFMNNTATVGRGGGVFAPATVKNSIFWGNTAVRGGDQAVDAAITHSDVQGGYTGTGNIDADPLFGQSGTLQSTSPCKNAGFSPALPQDMADLDWDGNTIEKVPYDLFGSQRKVSFVVDMGVYEIPLGGGVQ